MDSQQHYGIREVVPKFEYGTFEGSRLVLRTYPGHEKIIASFASEHEAKEYCDKVAKDIRARDTGGYMQVHEYFYRLETNATFTVVPVDVSLSGSSPS